MMLWQNLVHGWDNMKNLNVYSFLGLSTLENATCYPNYDKGTRLLSSGSRSW